MSVPSPQVCSADLLVFVKDNHMTPTNEYVDALNALIDGVRREAAGLISNQPDADGRAAAGNRLSDLADVASAKAAAVPSNPPATKGATA